MKQGWEIKKLGDVLVKTEMVDPTKKPESEFIYLDVSSVNKDTKEIEGATILLGKNAPSRARKLIRTNDVIFATVRPTHRRVAMITANYDEQICSTGFFVLRGKESIENKYLFYFLLTDEFNQQMEKLQKGASYPAVTDAEVKSIFLRYPKSLSEQQRIVAIVDEAFAAINKAKANTEQNLRNARELFDSYLNSLKADKVDLGSLVDIRTGKLNSNAAVENGEYPFFTCSREVYKIDKYAFDLEAILLAGNNASGDFNVKHYKGKFNAYQRTYVITVNEKQKILYRYLYFQLLKSLKDFKEMSVGANTRFLKLGMIQGLKIALPTITEQQTIVRQLDALRGETQRLEAVYQQKLQQLEALRKSILQQAFSGALTQKN